MPPSGDSAKDSLPFVYPPVFRITEQSPNCSSGHSISANGMTLGGQVHHSYNLDEVFLTSLV